MTIMNITATVGELFNDVPLSLTDLESIASGLTTTQNLTFCELHCETGSVMSASVDGDTLTVSVDVDDFVVSAEIQATKGTVMNEVYVVTKPPTPGAGGL